ncbi:MAG: Asp-tRNA(Asn)/Glu-tRNA(Gln) amidotransferase subunit GatC [Thermoflexales bacterium]
MLSNEEVERIAYLARLSLSEAEKARYAQQLSAILDYAAQLSRVEVGDDVPPTSSVLSVHSVMRLEDTILPGLTREAALRNAPLADESYFVVQAALGDDD